MKRVAIVYASRHGQTRRICEVLRDRISAMGDEVQLTEISKDNPTPEILPNTELIFVGAPVYAGRFPQPLMRWLNAEAPHWLTRRAAFFSVSLNAADPDPRARREDRDLLRKLVTASGWGPEFIASLRGALMYREYPWFIRWMMKRISAAAGGPVDTSKNHELTDWSTVDRFVTAVMTDDRTSEFSTSLQPKDASKKIATAILATALAATLFIPKSSVAKDAPAWNQTMGDLLKAIVELTPTLNSDTKGKDDAFREKLKRVAQLSEKIDQTSGHGKINAPDDDPGLVLLSRLFRQDMEAAVLVADEGKNEFAKALAKRSISYCIGCHTRSASGPQFPAIKEFQNSIQTLPWLDQISFKAATRQFDDALKDIHGKLKAPAKTVPPLELEQAVKIGMMVAVRAEENPDAALSLAEDVQTSPNATVSLKESAADWITDLRAWKKAPPLKPETPEKLMAATRNLIGDLDEGARTGRDEVKYLRASTLMHTLLRKDPQSPLAAEAMYWIGSSYDVLGDLGFWNLGDRYFLACIDRQPHSALAEKCYRRYEDSLILGYTGSAGTSVPSAVKKHLHEVQMKARKK